MSDTLESQTPSRFDPRDLRNAFGTFATGVTVITTREEAGTPRGFTANSFTSVSLDPPLLLVCIGKSAASLPVFSEGHGFAVNILGEDQKDLSGLFATQRPDKFEVTEWTSGKSGMPLLAGTLSWFECSRETVVDAGDHVILIGRVSDYAYRRNPPLGYVNGGYFTLEMERSLVKAAGRSSGTVIGAVLAQGQRVLLQAGSDDGPVTVPNTGLWGVEANLDALSGALETQSLKLSIDFLLSVYDDNTTGDCSIYYRGTATGEAPEGMQFFELDDIPFEKIEDEAMRFMLRRYVSELRQGRFAIYLGDEKQGETRRVDSTPEKSIV
ncbi:flavin reductase family protein [Pelagibius sp. Alg239-R121]|uniref:flavin reductase family protein n=1 Tax=Pelagibius sp. Alg239-R121 TaxID=2993448 RepID=UPI0024A75AD2|nr:flavin reductase family protein [Pelagibius sp. Alg239-R121]